MTRITVVSLLALLTLILTSGCSTAAPAPASPPTATLVAQVIPTTAPAVTSAPTIPPSLSATSTNAPTVAPTATPTAPPTVTPIPISRPAPATSSVPQPADDKKRATVQSILEGINAAWHDHNLAPLLFDPFLLELAQTRSDDMIARNYFSHNDPKTGTLIIETLINHPGFHYTLAAENIVQARNDNQPEPPMFEDSTSDELAARFVKLWLASPSHLENILTPEFNRTGIALGVSPDGRRIVATQIFSAD